ncbi:HopJ type III effector protein [Halopseudomonas bauzanensis]|uniref:HopJ type III effector protein n=1 Tax=Halopseudomonas bauzanensis TaxID=653930 RepID=A0A031M906_9GAMM|nr:HopJ type III effector protein [Halopseudomonas bauzanensis]EZQ15938.1 HopJ type III effector protein [Halopseudomonas bauzanensis]SES32595.1 HopJ type III effector protein [Halopseudomonas bauzanensis]SFM32638.1 HopJ type III effector protein [Halopseudomonas bauzanensis]
MTAEQLKTRLGSPEHCFADTLAFIEQHYHYRPSAFSNGPVRNSAEQNQGSCKVIAMALDQGLNDEQALQCFAEHYQAVLANPDGTEHANIRALMQHGLAGIAFEHPPLTRR